MKNVGIFGGSFDPVHLVHIQLAKAAYQAFGLDEVRLMPCAQQALKGHNPANAEARCAMLRLAVRNVSFLSLDSREVFRGGRTYTFDTLSELRKEEPDVRFWFIMGMDSVCDFPRWYRADELVELCEFIVFLRPGIKPPIYPFSTKLLAHQLKGPMINCSSTEIRHAVAKHAVFRYPIDTLVESYLRRHQLYN